VSQIEGYNFFLPRDYKRNADKQTEFKSLDKVAGESTITLGVKDQLPIDFLDRLTDKEKDLKVLCESVADDFLKNSNQNDAGEDKKVDDPTATVRYMVSSKPYIRKCNLISDKAKNDCWETHFRFEGYDLYISLLRRSFIAPIMDMYQDIIICSTFNIKHFEETQLKKEQENQDRVVTADEAEAMVNRASFNHLRDIHRSIMDTVHQSEDLIGSQTMFFKSII